MAKRILAVLLWFYVGLMVGSFLGMVLGVHPALGPILGTAAAAVIAVDPRGLIWRPTGISSSARSIQARD
jgi:hypothetical protein